MRYLKIFLISIFCILLTSCSATLERRYVKVDLLSETENELVFSFDCMESAKVFDVCVSYPSSDTACIDATAYLSGTGVSIIEMLTDKDLKGNFTVRVKNNPNLRFVVLGTKKHIIWIKNK